MSTFSLVDAFYISRLGTAALAALGFTMPVVNFFLSIVWGMMIGTTSVLSRVHGEGDMAKLRRLATDALVMGSIIVILASIAGYLTIDPIFRLLGAGEALMPMIRDFMSIWYGGMIFAALMMLSNACIRATGNTRLPSWLMTMASVINIVVDPFLIYGWCGLPRMGLAGASLTLVISYAVTAAVALYALTRRQNLLEPTAFHAGTLDSWKRLLHIGLPAILSNQIQPVSAAAVTWMAADLGNAAVAALGVSTRIEGLAVLLFYAMGAGLSIFTGQNYGAGNYGRVSEILNAAFKYALLWSAAMTGLLFAFSDMIPLMFDRHPDVVHYTSQYLRLVPASYIGVGVLVLSNASLNAMGKPLVATVLIFLRALALYIPLAYLMEKHYGFLGILLAMSLTNLIVGILSHLWNKIASP